MSFFSSSSSKILLSSPFWLKNFSQTIFRSRSATHSLLLFLHLRKAFISPSFLNNSLTGYRVYDWQFFSFTSWKVFCSFLALVISDKRGIFMWVRVPYSIAFSFYCFFKTSLFAYDFQKFIYDGFMDVLGFILLGTCSASWICVFVLFIKFGQLLPNICLNSLSAPVFLLLLRLLQFECSVSAIVSWNPEASFTFPSLFTLNCLGQLNSIDPFPSLSTLSLVVSTLLLSPSSHWLFVVAVVCLLKTSISLLRFSIFRLYFSIKFPVDYCSISLMPVLQL